MKRLTNNLIFLLIYLMIFFSLDKIAFGVNNSLFNFSRFLYALTSVSVLLIISIPSLRKLKFSYLLVGSLILYLIGKLLLFRDLQLVVGFYPYYIISEIFLYSIGIFYASRVGESIESLNNIIEEAILPNANQRIFKKENASVYIENEFVRGRRYNYPITALVIEPDSNVEKYPTNANLDTVITEIENKLKVQYIATKFTNVISNQVRLSDMIVELDAEQGKYLIICPELSFENSALFGERLKRAVNAQLGISVNYGVLNFPKDVLTYEAMLDKAEFTLTEPHNNHRLNT